MKRRLLLFFILFSSFAFAQNNIYRSGGITQTVGAPTFTPGASGNIVAIDTVTGEWYVNPNRLSGSSWISAGYRLTNISGSVPPAYTPTAHQSHFVVNAANELYYWDGSAWQSVGGGGSGDATRLKFLVVNKSGGTLNKGEVVYVSGAQGNRVAVKKALASADSLSANTLGVMDETVADNGEGYCVAEGLVSGINTSAFTEGAALYLSPTTAGAITQTKPTAPNHLVLIGYCVKSNNGSGEISVHIQNGYELGELHDVYVPTPTNGQVLTYDTTNARWEAATVADQSATNELQTIDTFSLSGQTLSASLSNDAQPAKTVTLPIVDVVAGTNVTVTKSNGVATVSATGGGGGTPAGSTGEIQYNNAGAFGASANLAWDNTNVRLNVGAPSSPTGRFNVKGGGATSSTVNLRLTNSGNTEILKVTDDGELTVFKPITSSGRLATFYGYQAPYQLEASIEVGMQNANDGIAVLGGSNVAGSRGGFIQTKNATTRSISFNGIGAVKVCGSQILSTDYTGLSVGSSTNIGSNVPTTEGVVFRTISGTITSTGGNANNFNQSSFGQITVNRTLLSTTYTDAANVYIVGPPIQGTATLTNRFSLFVASGNSYFAENIGVGQKVASARLHIQGSNTSSGTNALLVQNSTPSDLYKIENNGKISYWATNTAAGTTGAQTIDKPSGTVNFGIGDSALVVTNSLCTTNSIVFATVRTNDSTAYIKNVVPGSGSFTINLGANATAETSVGFFIIN